MSTIWLNLTQGSASVYINMNKVHWMAPNNMQDEAAGTVLYFGAGENEWLIVAEKLTDIRDRIAKGLGL